MLRGMMLLSHLPVLLQSYLISNVRWHRLILQLIALCQSVAAADLAGAVSLLEGLYSSPWGWLGEVGVASGGIGVEGRLRHLQLVVHLAMVG